jgi:adenine-specific DNA-methyltransferase
MLNTLFKSPKISHEFSKDNQLVLHQGDTLHFLNSLPNKSIQLVISSPPYNLGKKYETREGIQAYLDKQKPVIQEIFRILTDEGSVCWQVGNYVDNGEVFPLDIFYYDIFKNLGFKLRNRIIWHFGHGLHASKRFSGRYETLLWFSKTKDYLFNLDAIRVPAKYPGKTFYKGPKQGKPSGNPLGKNPSDFWGIIEKDWENQIWEIPNVKSNHPEKTIHPCQFPVELVERCVLAFTKEYDWVLDPFCGVGSTLIGALKHDRKALGCDKEVDYIKIAETRIHDLYNGSLKLRPIGKPVFQPTGKEKVSQIPEEWKIKQENQSDEDSGNLFIQ